MARRRNRRRNRSVIEFGPFARNAMKGLVIFLKNVHERVLDSSLVHLCRFMTEQTTCAFMMYCVLLLLVLEVTYFARFANISAVNWFHSILEWTIHMAVFGAIGARIGRSGIFHILINDILDVFHTIKKLFMKKWQDVLWIVGGIYLCLWTTPDKDSCSFLYTVNWTLQLSLLSDLYELFTT